MHRCLGTLEIVDEIVGHIHTSENPYRPGWTAAFARTCKFFLSPALDRIWYKQFGLERVLKCLPQDAWEVGPSADGECTTVLHVRRNLAPTDWARFDVYAPRVKELYMEDVPRRQPTYEPPPSYVAKLDNAWFGILRARFGDRALLCNLVALRFTFRVGTWDFPNSKTEMLMAMCLAPSVSHVQISGGVEPEDDELTARMLGHVVRRVPSVASMVLAESQMTARGLEDLALLRNLRQLRVCVPLTDHTPYETMRAISELPLLENLEFIDLHPLRVHKAILKSLEVIPAMNPSGFERLQNVNLCVAEFVVMTAMLRALRTAPLKHAVLRVSWILDDVADEDDDDEDEVDEDDGFPLCSVADIFTELGAGEYSTLETLSMHTSNFGNGDGVGAEREDSWSRILGIRALRPLFKFQNLRHVCLELLCALGLADGDVAELAGAWPRLEELHFIARQRGPPQVAAGSQRTVKSLLALATCCPQLAALTMSFDGRVLPPLPIAGENGFAPGHRLKSLSVGASPIGDASALASVLFTAFPNVVYVKYARKELDPASVAGWMKIARRAVGNMFPGEAQGVTRLPEGQNVSLVLFCSFLSSSMIHLRRTHIVVIV